MSFSATIVALPGDGIGPEVVEATLRVLDAIARKHHYDFRVREHLIGGSALDQTSSPLPDQTLSACLQSDAVLLGAVGGPKWDDPDAKQRPEQGLLGLRKELDLFANLRPVKPDPELWSASPLRRARLQGVDLLVVRELTGGIYFGQPRERREVAGETVAVDTMIYSEGEIRRVARCAFMAARQRRRKVTSVDKANVLETSRLWRQTATNVALGFPDVELEHLLVDAAAMHLLTRPADFDVILTANLFGDILTDEASILSGSLGNLPSASLGDHANRLGYPRGLYEPIHGSAPDIAGKNVANPIGAILSLAMLLRHSLGLNSGAAAIEQAVASALAAGCRTADMATAGQSPLSTDRITDTIIDHLLRGKDQGVSLES